jgi:hypothetical protein
MNENMISIRQNASIRILLWRFHDAQAVGGSIASNSNIVGIFEPNFARF